MQALRQMGSGIIIGLISLLLVIGGISLALAETPTPAPSTPTPLPSPPLLQLPTLAFLPTQTIESPTNSATAPAGATTTPPAPCIPPNGWIQITVGSNDTLYTIAERYKSTAELLSAANCLNTFNPPAGSSLFVPPVLTTVTVISCGAPAGWVKTHIVQAGDNLFRIALSYGITYPQLQRANCMGTSTTIYTGQRLWVPNIPTLTPIPGVTVIPNSPTFTSTATQIPTLTTVPPSAQPPTATSTFTVTSPPVPTATLTTAPTQTPSFTPITQSP